MKRNIQQMQLLVNIDVDDLDKGIRFYEDGLGFSLGRRLFDGTVAEMNGASAKVYLLENPSGTSATSDVATRRNYDRHWTPVHLDLEVEDVDEAVKRAEAAGAKREREIRSFSWGRLATMSDPFGHGFCLLQFTGRGYDDA